MALLWVALLLLILRTDGCAESSKLYFSYKEDVIWDIKREDKGRKLEEIIYINNIYQSLKFTIECENEGSIPFLDTCIMNIIGNISLTWY